MEDILDIARLRQFPSILLSQPWPMPPNETQYVREQLPRYFVFCAPLPPSAIMRNPDVSAFAWEEELSFACVSGDTSASQRVCSSC